MPSISFIVWVLPALPSTCGDNGIHPCCRIVSATPRLVPSYVVVLVWGDTVVTHPSSPLLRKQSFRCKEQQSHLLEEKVFLEDVLPGTSRDCLGMVHGRISKLLLDMDSEKELEEELRVRREV